MLLIAAASAAGQSSVTGQNPTLSAYLDALNQSEQFRIVFSSSVVTEDMRLSAAVGPAPSVEELQGILRLFGLIAIDGPAGSLLVVQQAEKDNNPLRGEHRPNTPIPEVVVTSSLHRVALRSPESHTYLARHLADRVPVKADEAVRLVNRLPGVSGGEISVRGHVRGGEQNEVLFLFDGLRLYEPFHLKDFQTVATIINSSAIAGIDTFTGAFPSRFGDRMSGVTSIDMRIAEEPIETELALSFFNTSATSLGRFGNEDQGEWLLTARRGNLDLIADLIDPERGSPDYQDYLAHVAWSFGRFGEISVNLLYSKDKLSMSDPGRGEEAGADYRNEVLWLKWQTHWSDSLSSTTILALSDISNRRTGALQLQGIVSGSLNEKREFDAVEFLQEWSWLANDKLMLNVGVNLKQLDASYQFSSAQFVSAPFSSILQNVPATLRNFNLDPSGAQYAAFTEVRWQLFQNMTLDFGLRWDQQNYTTATDDQQYSPRFSVLYRADQRTELRLGWGQYYQAQEINELPVSDGIADYFPAQRAEHLVARLEHSMTGDIDFNLSLYRKTFRSLRPRFENSFNTLTLLPELQFDRVGIAAPEAEAVGAEVALIRNGADDAVFWWLSYGWSSVEDKVAGEKLPRSWDQTQTLKAGINWSLGDWNLSLAGEVHSGWPTTSLTGQLVSTAGGDDELVLMVGAPNSTSYSTYHTLDARVSRDFSVGQGNLNVFLEISNLYNRDNACCVEYSLAADGNLVGQERNWLPLVPNLGVVWRF